MAQYTTVVWEEGDEVTSQKLGQMAQNEQYIKDNLIIGNANFVPNSIGTTTRAAGIASVTKMEVLEIDYDSQVPAKYYDFTVRFPPVFTQPPVIFFSNYDHDEDTVLRIYTKNGNTSAIFRVWNTSLLSRRHHGHVTVLLLGS
jgi:hypothetical protein